MSKILIVVDMQNDFCLESGSLYVKGATPALWNIEELMYKEHFDRVWFTVDWHAFFHPSFKENGEFHYSNSYIYNSSCVCPC